MIALSQLTEAIQNGLNAISTKEFVIFTDVGEFRKAYRGEGSNTITHYINGIMEAMTPTRMPMKNLQVLTQSFRISFVLDMDLLEKDTDGNYKEVKQVRAILEKYIASVNGKPFALSDSESVSFEITPSYSGVIVGTATQLSPIGNVLPMYLDFSCVFIQSGVNTNTVDFIINGENMFYQEYSITRLRVAETNMIANEKSSKTLVQSNGISLNLKMPMLNTTQSKAIESDVWNGGQNEALCVERYRANATKSYQAYIMIYGNNAENGGIGQNIGQVVDLVEGKQSELEYPHSADGKGWTVTEFTTAGEWFTQTITITGIKSVVVFWGDGEISKYLATQGSSSIEIGHSYAEVGTYTIRYFVY